MTITTVYTENLTVPFSDPTGLFWGQGVLGGVADFVGCVFSGIALYPPTAGGALVELGSAVGGAGGAILAAGAAIPASYLAVGVGAVLLGTAAIVAGVSMVASEC